MMTLTKSNEANKNMMPLKQLIKTFLPKLYNVTISLFKR